MVVKCAQMIAPDTNVDCNDIRETEGIGNDCEINNIELSRNSGSWSSNNTNVDISRDNTDADDSSSSKYHGGLAGGGHIGCNDKIVTLIDVIAIDSLFDQLQDYLNYDSINNLLNASKKLQSEKNSRYYLELNYEYSVEYHCKDTFRCQLNSMLTDVNKQLSLNFRYYDDLINVSALGNVHSLDLSHCINLVDVSALYNVQSLDISNCQQINNVSNLGNVLSLDISYCDGITDFSALGYVHSLNASHCSGVTNVSDLGNVHPLDISYCHRITDFSALGHVHSLNVSHCSGVTNASDLGNVHSLDISYCNGITDIYNLANVHLLNASHCYGITDIYNLRNVHSLNISGCHNITDKISDVSNLGNVHT